MVQEITPAGSKILVLSKGDLAMLEFPGRVGWHFPRAIDGSYLGYNPACSTAAIAQLEAARAQGADFLLVPHTAFWWFEHYVAFKNHLDQRYRLARHLPELCSLYSLREPSTQTTAKVPLEFEAFLFEFELRYQRTPSILDWRSGLGGMLDLLPATAFLPESHGALLPYLDKSVDVVLARNEEGHVQTESHRVASVAVVQPASPDSPTGAALDIDWVARNTAPRKPSVSIIIPCHNHRGLTEACLDSLMSTLPVGVPAEAVLVDDASSGDTANFLRQRCRTDSRLRFVRHQRNRGFVESCNHGAKEATGDYLVFLNNDVVLLPGWLPPLLRVFHAFENTGAVGAKLLSPDGVLQEAGALVFQDGSALNFGRGDTNPEDPLYGFVREVDYCSGALLATPRKLFLQLGGFDKFYSPGYYEDTDYCFRLRQQGYRVFYQPESAVVHSEGGTAGTDPSQGMKRFQPINQAKFRQRWTIELAQYPPPPSRVDKALLHEIWARSEATVKEVQP